MSERLEKFKSLATEALQLAMKSTIEEEKPEVAAATLMGAQVAGLVRVLELLEEISAKLDKTE